MDTIDHNAENFKDMVNSWSVDGLNFDQQEQNRIIALAQGHGIEVEFIRNTTDISYLPIPSDMNFPLDEEAISTLSAAKSSTVGTAGCASSGATISSILVSCVSSASTASSASSAGSAQGHVDSSEEHYVDLINQSAGELGDYIRGNKP